MKVAIILASLLQILSFYVTLVGSSELQQQGGGLRLSTTNDNVDVDKHIILDTTNDEALELFVDSENAFHRHSLDLDIVDSDQQDQHQHEHHRRDQSVWSNTCGDNICGYTESSTQCPADCKHIKLQTSTMGQREGQGYMFYVKAKRDISIKAFDIYTGKRSSNGSGEIVQIYTRRNKYNGYIRSSIGWDNISTYSMQLLGENTPSRVRIPNSKHVVVRAGEIQSFFIYTPTNTIKNRMGRTEGSVWTQDRNLIFYEGVGKTSKFGGSYSANVQTPRVFRGQIHYDALANGSVSTFSSSRTNDPLTAGAQKDSRILCDAQTQRRVHIEIKTDLYGYETSWSFKKKGSSQVIYLGPDDTKYESTTSYSGTVCLDIDMYEFTINDDFKDGLCCSAGRGYYKVDVESSLESSGWRQAVQGTQFTSATKTHVIDVGSIESQMTNRDDLYLEAHNKRRKDWHGRYNKKYVPLKWSTGLKESSVRYAQKLLESCQTGPPVHAPNNPWGENISRNKGGPNTFGRLYEPDLVVRRFVDHEEGLPWARNGMYYTVFASYDFYIYFLMRIAYDTVKTHIHLK